MATKNFKLMESFNEQMAKSKVKGVNNKAQFDVSYPTGFLGLDYLNGTTVFVNAKGINMQYNSLGFTDGSATTIAGRTNCGKSSLTFQIVGNILRTVPKTYAYIDDIEGSIPAPRKEYLLNLSREDLNERVDIRNTGITTESVFERIKAIHGLKISNHSYFDYDTGLYDTDGNRIIKMAPTIYVIDSLAMLMPEEIAEDDELGGNMTAAHVAKRNTQLVKKMTQLAKEANIMLITINHLQKKFETNMFARSKGQASGLGDEKLPGGEAALYLAVNLFTIYDKTTLKASEGFGIDGSICYVKIIKSKTNRSLREVPLVFNKTNGKFDELLSLLQLLKEEGRLEGAGQGVHLVSEPDLKFSLKGFKQKYAENLELRQAFARECHSILVGYLSVTKNRDADVGIIDDMNQMILGMDDPVVA